VVTLQALPSPVAAQDLYTYLQPRVHAPNTIVTEAKAYANGLFTTVVPTFYRLRTDFIRKLFVGQTPPPGAADPNASLLDGVVTFFGQHEPLLCHITVPPQAPHPQAKLLLQLHSRQAVGHLVNLSYGLRCAFAHGNTRRTFSGALSSFMQTDAAGRLVIDPATTRPRVATAAAVSLLLNDGIPPGVPPNDIRIADRQSDDRRRRRSFEPQPRIP